MTLPPAEIQPFATSAMDEFKRKFVEDGYFVVPNAIPAEPLAELHQTITAEYERKKASGELFAGGGQLSGHLNCFPGAGTRFIYDILEKRGIINLIKELDPKINRLPNIGCNFNLPNSGTQHYHPDRYFTGHFMICNITIVDTTLENGAIEVVPGTHKRFYPYWKFALEAPYRKAIRLPSRRGDILVRNSNTWHRGMPNTTTVARPMIALTWEDGGCSSDFKDDPWSYNEGAIQFRPNWFAPTPIGRLRERVFVTIPASYATYRFVASLFGKGYSS